MFPLRSHGWSSLLPVIFQHVSFYSSVNFGCYLQHLLTRHIKWLNDAINQRHRFTVKNILLFNQVKGLLFSNCFYYYYYYGKKLINTCISPWALGRGGCLRVTGGREALVGDGEGDGFDQSVGSDYTLINITQHPTECFQNNGK